MFTKTELYEIALKLADGVVSLLLIGLMVPGEVGLALFYAAVLGIPVIVGILCFAKRMRQCDSLSTVSICNQCRAISFSCQACLLPRDSGLTRTTNLLYSASAVELLLVPPT